MKLMCKTSLVNHFRHSMPQSQALIAGLLVLCALVLSIRSLQSIEAEAQNASATSLPADGVAVFDLSFEVVSMTLQGFDKEVVLGVGDEAKRYRDALVVVAAVNEKDLDQLPPSLAPQLIIDGVAYGIHRMLPVKKAGEPRHLEFHLTDWQRLENGAPMYLTTESPRRVDQRSGTSKDNPRFDKAKIQKPT